MSWLFWFWGCKLFNISKGRGIEGIPGLMELVPAWFCRACAGMVKLGMIVGRGFAFRGMGVAFFGASFDGAGVRGGGVGASSYSDLVEEKIG